MNPVHYDILTDFARFDLTQTQAQAIAAKKFVHRVDYAGVQGHPYGVVLHIQEGYTWGSLQSWADPNRDASSSVMIQRDGTILRVIPDNDGPWTNGDAMAALPRGQELINLGGNVNVWSLTIEFEGMPFVPLTADQFNAGCWQIEQWWNQYPQTKAHGLFGHFQINQINRPNCPSNAVFDPFVSHYGLNPDGSVGSGSMTQYSSPEMTLVDWMMKQTPNVPVLSNGATMVRMDISLASKVDMPRHRTASVNSSSIGPVLPAGTVFDAIGLMFLNKQVWALTKYGTRFLIEDTAQ